MGFDNTTGQANATLLSINWRVSTAYRTLLAFHEQYSTIAMKSKLREFKSKVTLDRIIELVVIQ